MIQSSTLLGRALFRAREELNLPIDQMARELKLAPELLMQLESGGLLLLPQMRTRVSLEVRRLTGHTLSWFLHDGDDVADEDPLPESRSVRARAQTTMKGTFPVQQDDEALVSLSFEEYTAIGNMLALAGYKNLLIFMHGDVDRAKLLARKFNLKIEQRQGQPPP